MEKNLQDKNNLIALWQIRKIHTLKNILCLSDKAYRRYLRSFNVCSSKNLTETEANILINIFEDKVNTLNLKKKKRLSGNKELATPLQIKRISLTWKDLCKDKSPENVKSTLWNYLLKHFHISSFKTLTKNKAGKIIAVLDKILLKKIQKEELKAI